MIHKVKMALLYLIVLCILTVYMPVFGKGVGLAGDAYAATAFFDSKYIRKNMTFACGEVVFLIPDTPCNSITNWKSSNKKVVYFNDLNQLVAVKPGKATIKCNVDGRVVAIKATVKEGYIKLPTMYYHEDGHGYFYSTGDFTQHKDHGRGIKNRTGCMNGHWDEGMSFAGTRKTKKGVEKILLKPCLPYPEMTVYKGAKATARLMGKSKTGQMYEIPTGYKSHFRFQGEKAEWKSSDTKVIKVDKNYGVMQAVGCGTATVSCKIREGYTLKTKITVIPYTKKTYTVKVGESIKLKAATKPKVTCWYYKGNVTDRNAMSDCAKLEKDGTITGKIPGVVTVEGRAWDERDVLVTYKVKIIA